MLLLKKHTQNMEERLFPDTFLINKNAVYLCINSLKVLYSLLLLYINLMTFEVQ